MSKLASLLLVPSVPNKELLAIGSWPVHTGTTGSASLHRVLDGIGRGRSVASDRMGPAAIQASDLGQCRLAGQVGGSEESLLPQEQQCPEMNSLPKRANQELYTHSYHYGQDRRVMAGRLVVVGRSR